MHMQFMGAIGRVFVYQEVGERPLHLHTVLFHSMHTATHDHACYILHFKARAMWNCIAR